MPYTQLYQSDNCYTINPKKQEKKKEQVGELVNPHAFDTGMPLGRQGRVCRHGYQQNDQSTKTHHGIQVVCLEALRLFRIMEITAQPK